MSKQKWKTDPKLFDCPREDNGVQSKKQMDYDGDYVREFLDSDPLRDWESIDRCKWLWNWCMEQVPHLPHIRNVLDCGSKDGQFPKWIEEQGMEALGVEVSEEYVKYAQERHRPVVQADVCGMPDEWEDKFDFVFSHHLHGLTPDYLKALEEMYRVTSYYMVALNQVPGNKRKHFSYIGSPDIFTEFVERNPCKVLYNDYLDTGYGNEWIIFIEKGEDGVVL
jgi:hypothetical protein